MRAAIDATRGSAATRRRRCPRAADGPRRPRRRGVGGRRRDRWRRRATTRSPRAGRGPLRHLGRDRPAALGAHRAHDRGRAAAPGRRRRRRQRQRLGDGARPDGRPRRGVRHPARPRPRVHRPLHDARPEPDGPGVGAARRARPRRPRHPRPDRGPAADRRLPGGTGVWDVDSIGLVEILARLNRGEDAAGSPIGQPAVVHDRLRARPDCRRRGERVGPARAQDRGRGAPRDDPAAVLDRAGRGDVRRGGRRFGRAAFPVPVLLGVLPLQSSRHAEFLHHEVPGITIPDAARAALKRPANTGRRSGCASPRSCWRPSTSGSPGRTSCPRSVATSRRPSSSGASGRRGWRRRSAHARRSISRVRRDDDRVRMPGKAGARTPATFRRSPHGARPERAPIPACLVDGRCRWSRSSGSQRGAAAHRTCGRR